MAQSIGEEIGKGATVVGMVPVSLMKDGEEGDFTTLRVAVYYLGGEETPPPTEAEAVATLATEEESPAPSLVEDIMQIPE